MKRDLNIAAKVFLISGILLIALSGFFIGLNIKAQSEAEEKISEVTDIIKTVMPKPKEISSSDKYADKSGGAMIEIDGVNFQGIIDWKSEDVMMPLANNTYLNEAADERLQKCVPVKIYGEPGNGIIVDIPFCEGEYAVIKQTNVSDEIDILSVSGEKFRYTVRRISNEYDYSKGLENDEMVINIFSEDELESLVLKCVLED